MEGLCREAGLILQGANLPPTDFGVLSSGKSSVAQATGHAILVVLPSGFFAA
jgi:hypothetical protein